MTQARRPNILFVLADDLDHAEMQFMPRTRALIGGRGVTFDNYFVSNSLCCPSRVTMLRGQYAHNTGVWSNGGDNGGFARAYALGIERDTVATRLQAAGYTMSLTGKYLNGYPSDASIDYVPPGWDNWASAVFGNPYGEYDYVLNEDETYHRYGHTSSDYGTDVYVRLTDQFVRAAVRQHQPFFAYLPVYAPHQPATPASQDAHKFATTPLPTPPSFNQADVSRMPAFVRDLPAFSSVETAAITSLYRLRIRSLQAVDRGVARLMRTLRAVGALRNTYIVFASDNGFHLGQHRLPAGKQTVYESDIHVPLLVRGPGVRVGVHVTPIVGHTDLAPTFEAIAGLRAPSATDGRSFLPLLRGDPVRHWRRSYLVEHRIETGVIQPPPSDIRGSRTLEPVDPDQALLPLHHREIRDQMLLLRGVEIPDYDAVRTSRYLYAEYGNGDRELYDLRADPDEIDNLAGTQAELERRLEQRIAELRDCRGTTCRRAEDAAR